VAETSSTIEVILPERRRPGRAEYTDRHLIQLLRYRAEPYHFPDLGDDAPGRETGPVGQDVTLYDTISLIDGAGQAGYPEHDSRDGPDLANQVCYVAGTLIATTRGIVPVEDLIAGGDTVLTHSRKRAVTWTRQFNLSLAGRTHPEWAAPVCFRRDSIASGVPGRDLFISPSHRLWVDGRLTPAWRLIDNRSVVQDLEQTSVAYVHVLFAPAPERTAPLWHKVPGSEDCGENGSAVPAVEPECGVRLIIDGKAATPMESGKHRQVFIVPPGRQVVQMTSSSKASVVRIEIVGQDRYDVIPADHPGLQAGWGPCEDRDGVMFRPLLGIADLPLHNSAAYAKVIVYLKDS
jgi:hypothetical protein